MNRLLSLLASALALLTFAASDMSAQPGFAWWPTGGPEGGELSSIVAARGGRVFAASRNGGIWRSADNGATWTEPDTSMRNLGIDGLAVAPNGDVYAYGVPSAVADDTWTPGLYVSRDNGASWRLLEGPGVPAMVSACAVAPNGNLYAGTFTGGLLRSANGGETWQRISEADFISRVVTARDGTVYYAATEIGAPSRIMRYRPDGDTATLALPTPPSTVNDMVVRRTGELLISTSEGLFRTRNRGANWVALQFSGPALPRTLVADSAGLLFGFTYEGLYTSNDTGTTWSRAAGEPPASGVMAAAADADGRIVAGTFSEGAARTTDRGGSWSVVSGGIVATSITALATSQSGRVLAGTDAGLFARTPAAGWRRVNLPARYLRALTVVDGAVYVGAASFGAGSATFFRSTDDGETWTTLDASGFSANAIAVDGAGTMFYTDGFRLMRRRAAELFFTEVRGGEGMDAIAVAPGGNLMVAVRDSGVFVSSDTGTTFSPASDIVPGDDVVAFAVRGSSVYAIGQQLYRSTNGGASWSPEPLPAEATTSARAIAVDSRGNLMAGFDGDGVWLLKDQGTPRNEPRRVGLPTPFVGALAYDSTGTPLAGTIGFGLYEEHVGSGVVARTAASILNARCIPNPCSDAALVEFSLDRPATAGMTLFAANGTVALRIPQRAYDPGAGRFTFNVADLAPGVYVARITTGSAVASVPVVVVR